MYVGLVGGKEPPRVSRRLAYRKIHSSGAPLPERKWAPSVYRLGETQS